MKKIGFLSFGHWSASRQSATRSAGDVLQQSIELAEAAEELGADGAYFRVHHFAQQLASPFPLLAAVGARTRRIEVRRFGRAFMADSDGRIRRIVLAVEDTREDHDANRPVVSRIVRVVAHDAAKSAGPSLRLALRAGASLRTTVHGPR